MLPSNHVLICNEKGYVVDITIEKDAGEGIQKVAGIVSPGFINCHCHLELSHMRGLIAEKSGLVDFVFSVVTQRHFPELQIMDAIATAESEIIRNGIVAVGDICNSLHTLPQKLKNNLNYYNFIEAAGWLPGIAQQRFDRSKEIYETLAAASMASIVPHAPYSVAEPLWQLIKPYYQNKVVTIHNQETAFEDELFLIKSGDFIRMYEMMKLDTSFFTPSGKSSIQTYFNNLTGASGILLVHNTFTKEEDVNFILRSRVDRAVSFCLCVNANLYIEQAVPPIEMLRKNNCKIVLGTDSLASNRSLSILDEIKTIHNHFPAIDLKELLTWATINGARALQMDRSLGSFEKGKQPGVVLLENVGLREKSMQLAKVRRLL